MFELCFDAARGTSRGQCRCRSPCSTARSVSQRDLKLSFPCQLDRASGRAAGVQPRRWHRRHHRLSARRAPASARGAVLGLARMLCGERGARSHARGVVLRALDTGRGRCAACPLRPPAMCRATVRWRPHSPHINGAPWCAASESALVRGRADQDALTARMEPPAAYGTRRAGVQ